jgi:hypothetical protein
VHELIDVRMNSPKRGINGVYQSSIFTATCSEFDFRYNSRELKDGERMVMAIKQTGGKRLMLRDSKQAAESFYYQFLISFARKSRKKYS